MSKRRKLSRKALRRAVYPLVEKGHWDNQVFNKRRSTLSRWYSDSDNLSGIARSIAYEMNNDLPF